MNRRFSFNKAFWGLLFLLAAAGLVLNQFNFWPNVYNISVTGAIFTLFFLWMLIQGLQHKNFFAIVFALAFMLPDQYFYDLRGSFTRKYRTFHALSKVAPFF